ncbi:hypothetical protein CHF27_006730 [Romboutsia maritimum]|uniref:Cell wall-binding protein n=1 Tax=Romboutsia maritimum TaxID=2020948 RepID=A0A371ITK9_9FIRM|nr:hypothetical protein [Romboutsia maritimum]RDY23811.1 hypothetical protein CHF27_006730 [Romboutsia maritimum]
MRIKSKIIYSIFLGLLFFTTNTSDIKAEQTIYGWQKDKDNWYFFDDSGVMVHDTAFYIGGKLYCFESDGAISKRVGFSDGRYFNGDGTLRTGWFKYNNKWYYINQHTGLLCKDGAYNVLSDWYYFNKDGSMTTHKGWINHKEVDQKTNKTYTAWYYSNGNGTVKTDWFKDNGRWYYFGKQEGSSEYYSLEMYTGFRYVDGKLYHFYDNGWMSYKQGWIKNDKGWHYLNGDGTVKTGWLKSDNKWYYFDGQGKMLSDTKCMVDNKLQSFNKDGVWIG